MTTVIYAAGRGLRLGAEYTDRPKILIDVGGKTLLEWHVLRLREAGLQEIHVVTGFQRERVSEESASLVQRHGVRIHEIVNPDFEEGSVLSFAASLPILARARGSALIMDGDVLYPVAFLRRLIASPHASVLLIDRNYSTTDDDPVLVPIRNGRPVDFVKRWKGIADAVGESIGFFKVDPADLPFLTDQTRKRASEGRRHESYDEVLRALVLDGRMAYEDVTGLPWTEIDFPADVEYARSVVLPAIARLAE